MNNKTIASKKNGKTIGEGEKLLIDANNFKHLRFTNEQLEILASIYIYCYKNIGSSVLDDIVTHDFKAKYNIDYCYKVPFILSNLNYVAKKIYPIEEIAGCKRIYKIYLDIINNPEKLESSKLNLMHFIDTYSVDPSAYYDVFSLDGSNVMSLDEYEKKHKNKN